MPRIPYDLPVSFRLSAGLTDFESIRRVHEEIARRRLDDVPPAWAVPNKFPAARKS